VTDYVQALTFNPQSGERKRGRERKREREGKRENMNYIKYC
jgi:hypothetical protein